MLMEKIAVTDAKRPLDLETSDPPPLPSALGAAFMLMGTSMRYERNAEIYGEDEPAEYFYKVVLGAVRTYKLLSDGRRQISAFHLPGDIFGLTAGSSYHFTAEAVANSTILAVKRSALVALAARHSDVASELWTLTAGNLGRAQEHMLLLGRRNAEERVATFILDMAKRAAGDRAIELPMSRQDIADYLGLTIETVSRTLTHLENETAIELASSRKICVRNQKALQRLNA